MTCAKYKYRGLIGLLFLTFLCTSVRAQNPTPAPDQSQPMALIGATIHVGDGTVIENGTVLFKDGKLERVAAGGTVPSGYETVDVSDKHIYPGLIALNSQLGLTEIGAVRSTRDDRETGSLNPNARALIAFNTDSQVIPTVRSRGVLLAQITPVGGMVSGRSSIAGRRPGRLPEGSRCLL